MFTPGRLLKKEGSRTTANAKKTAVCMCLQSAEIGRRWDGQCAAKTGNTLKKGKNKQPRESSEAQQIAKK
jgi:hypothetical protein